MAKTNADQFRSNMKEWLEAARKEPVKITRKTGESFVLINSESYEKILLDLARLEGLTASLSAVAQGLATPATDESLRDTFSKAKRKALADRKRRKAVG